MHAVAVPFRSRIPRSSRLGPAGALLLTVLLWIAAPAEAQRVAEPYTIIRYADETFLVDVEAGDYAMQYKNRQSSVGTISIFDGATRIDSFDVEADGTRRLFNDRARQLRFVAEGAADFALTDARLGDNFDARSASLETTFDSRFAVGAYRGTRPFHVCVDADRPVRVSIYTSEFVLFREAEAAQVQVHLPKNVSFSSLPVFFETTGETRLNVTISVDGCDTASGAVGKGGEGGRTKARSSIPSVSVPLFAAAALMCLLRRRNDTRL